jgi:monofunctional biosynthetic peptidoglycan transglycosylase
MLKKIFVWFLKLTAAFMLGSLAIVLLYKFIPPPATPLMLLRVVEGALEGRWVGITNAWMPLDEISPNLQRAVIASEDSRFLTHGGIDWDAVEEAKRRNERAETRAEARRKRGKPARTKLYGASTITMQTAKNVFLFPARNYIRKAFEVYFTYLIEFIWGKRRILEMYLNEIEMGDGIYGAEAASQAYFKKPARKLTQYEAALIAAVLPDPRRRSPARPTAYLQRRAATIQAQMVGMTLPKE